MPSGLVRPLCRAGAAPSGRETVRAPFDGPKPGLAPGTDPGGPAATRAGVCAAGSLARRATPAPPERKAVRASHDGLAPGTDPGGPAITSEPKNSILLRPRLPHGAAAAEGGF